MRQLCLRKLNTGQEAVLLRGPFEEITVRPGGSGLTFGYATSHFNQQLFVLLLAPPASEGGVPRVLGPTRQLTNSKGLWHIHNGGWFRDCKSIVYARDADQADILGIENYRQ